MNPLNYTALLESVISGNIEIVNDCIEQGVNIYGRTEKMETLLYIAMLHGHNHVTNILLEIYRNDLLFIECAYKTDVCSTFWIETPILIAFGKKNIKEFETLYRKYKKCEDCKFVNMGKCVIFLLKLDNYNCDKVLLLSPTTREGKMLVVSMIKCVNSNGLLNLNAETPDANSLLRVSVRSGLLNMFDALLNFGAEIDNILEFACYAIEFNRIEFLDGLTKRFKFRFYDWINSKEYYWPIFKGDNWDAFKYVIEKIITETELTFNAVLNLTVPYPGTPLTIFEYAIFARQFKIAENCLKYMDCNQERSKKICDLLYLGPESENVLLKFIECDPTVLENTSSNVKHFFHDIVYTMRIETVQKIYKKYPAAKKIFFKHKDSSLDAIDRLLATGQVDKVECVLENSRDHLDVDTLSAITYKMVGTNCANIFSYLTSVTGFDMSSLDSARLITATVRNINLHIFNIVMLSQPDYDLNRIQCLDNNFNLLQMLLTQTGNDDAQVIGKFFEELIQRDVNYQIVSSCGKNLLHHSVEFDNYEVTKKLLSLGVNLDHRDNYGKLPVHYVRSITIYQLLNTSTPTSYENVPTVLENNTILHLCISSGDDRYDLIKYILDTGGNVNACNDDGRTPIYYVRTYKIAELLSKYKPDLNIVDTNGYSPLINFIRDFGHNHAIINLFYDPQMFRKNREVQKYFATRCNEPHGDGTFFLEMIHSCDICSNLMIDLPNIDLLEKTSLGNTALHIAAGLHKYDIVDKLIKRGLSLDTRNNDDETPFLLFMRNDLVSGGYDDGYKRLLKYKPKVYRKTKEGLTPLTYAIRQFNVYTYDLICELILRGANLLDVCECDRTLYLMEMAYETQQVFRFAL